jgi:hypothetical protein
LLANTCRDASQTCITVSCSQKSLSHNGSRSQQARSAKIRAARRDRADFLVTTIHEKNRALVNLRSLLLEPPRQRVYHVDFANTLRAHARAIRAQLAVANGVRINVAARRSIGSFRFLELEAWKRIAAGEVDRPPVAARRDGLPMGEK